MTTIHIESVFVESAPFPAAVEPYPFLGAIELILDELPHDLPREFVDALLDLHKRMDNTQCWRCEEPTGYVLVYREGRFPEERVEWRPTCLARADGGPVAVLCEECAPQVPADPEEVAEIQEFWAAGGGAW